MSIEQTALKRQYIFAEPRRLNNAHREPLDFDGMWSNAVAFSSLVVLVETVVFLVLRM